MFSRLGLLVLTLISAAALSEALVILLRLAWRAWRTPVIFADSAALIRPEDQWGPALVPWVLSQHNEHRIIVQRLSSLFGEAVLHLPPAAGGVPANVLLLLAISGSLAWICALLIQPRHAAVTCWLVCTLLAWHPRQWENMIWEFQTPWFLISLLVLLNTAIQLQAPRGLAQQRLAQTFAAIAPPLAIFSSGQGFAAAAAICAGALASTRRAGILALGSTVMAMVIFFAFGYHKPDGHPALHFDLRFFFSLLLSSLPRDRGALLLSFLILTAWVLPGRASKQELQIQSQPILFVLMFALLTSLSRSGFGLAAARASRYSSYSLLVLISLLIFVISKLNKQSWQQIFVLATTLLLVMKPSANFNWSQDYQGLLERYGDRVSWTECALLSSGRQCLKQKLWPNDNPSWVMRDYFKSDQSLKGWHRQVAQSRPEQEEQP